MEGYRGIDQLVDLPYHDPNGCIFYASSGYTIPPEGKALASQNFCRGVNSVYISGLAGQSARFPHVQAVILDFLVQRGATDLEDLTGSSLAAFNGVKDVLDIILLDFFKGNKLV